MKRLTNLAQDLRRLITSPLGELNRVQRFMRNAVDLARHCARSLARDRAPQMVAALTYRTIFSLVPTVVLAMLVFKAFVQADSTEAKIQDYVYRVMNIKILEQGADTQGNDLQERIDELITEFTDNAYKLSFQNVGGVGLLLLIWGALALVITVEQCFNRIYNAPTGRPWHQRIMLYWAVLTLGPVLLVISFYLGEGVGAKASGIKAFAWFVQFFGNFGGFGATWLLLLLLYVFMPNAKVHLRPAATGSLIAAILWQAGQWAFALYVQHAVTYSALYGSLGLIPLFLVWMYLTWLIVLFGLELTYTLQTLPGWQLKQDEARREAALPADPRWLIPMMTQICHAFGQGNTTDRQSLVERLGLPQHMVTDLANRLEEAGFVHQVSPASGVEGTYALAMPPDQIRLAKLIALGGRLSSPDQDGVDLAFNLLDDLTKAQQQVVQDQTLADLVADIDR